jgi:hypothetical protein
MWCCESVGTEVSIIVNGRWERGVVVVVVVVVPAAVVVVVVAVAGVVPAAIVVVVIADAGICVYVIVVVYSGRNGSAATAANGIEGSGIVRFIVIAGYVMKPGCDIGYRVNGIIGGSLEDDMITSREVRGREVEVQGVRALAQLIITKIGGRGSGHKGGCEGCVHTKVRGGGVVGRGKNHWSGTMRG